MERPDPRALARLLLLALGVGAAGCAGPAQDSELRGPFGAAVNAPPAPVESIGITRITTGGAAGEDLFPAPLPHGDGVVFSSSRHTRELKLFLKEAGTPGVLRLTSGPGNDIHAVVAPDGGSLIFASDRDGAFRLYRITDLRRGGVAVPLTSAAYEAIHPCFDGRGERVCYMRRSPHGPWEVWVHDLRDGSDRWIGEGLFPEFHPHEDRIVVQRARQRDARWYSLHLLDLERGLERELIAWENQGAVNPSYDPTGRWIIFNSVREPESAGAAPHGDDLWCITEAGGRPTRLTRTPGAEWNPVWGRDGHVYFSARTSRSTEIHRMSPRLSPFAGPNTVTLGTGLPGPEGR